MRSLEESEDDEIIMEDSSKREEDQPLLIGPKIPKCTTNLNKIRGEINSQVHSEVDEKIE